MHTTMLKLAIPGCIPGCQETSHFLHPPPNCKLSRHHIPGVCRVKGWSTGTNCRRWGGVSSRWVSSPPVPIGLPSQALFLDSEQAWGAHQLHWKPMRRRIVKFPLKTPLQGVRQGFGWQLGVEWAQAPLLNPLGVSLWGDGWTLSHPGFGVPNYCSYTYSEAFQGC